MATDDAGRDMHAIVDMGSNGIRFSITDLTPRRARLLRQAHHHRAPISLHDAQFAAGSAARRPVPRATIDSVAAALRSFQRVCDAHGVPARNVRLLATEATRTAPNADELVAAIRECTGWTDISLLPKEEEARLGALGIAASVPACRGVVLDLGGGSVQMSWVRTHDNGARPTVSDEAVSLPYGAAALMKRLDGHGADGGAVEQVQREVEREMAQALKKISLPDDLLDAQRSVPVYLSGGGFRGWGYLLMASHADGPYPMQMISGYSVGWDEFTDVKRIDTLVKKGASADTREDTGIHRISARRLSQLPAIKVVVRSLAAVLEEARIRVNRVTFCAGGVPVGLLFDKLDNERRAESAVSVAAALDTNRTDVATLNPDRLKHAFAPLFGMTVVPASLRSLDTAAAHLVNAHASLPKDIRAAAALRYATTGSVALSGALGIDHAQRAALGLLLCARWGGESELPQVDADEFMRLRGVLGAAGSWWAELLGRVTALVADIGTHGGARVTDVQGSVGTDEKARDVLALALTLDGGGAGLVEELTGGREDEDAEADGLVTGSGLRKAVKAICKTGKKKNWVGVRAPDGRQQAYGMRASVAVASHGV